MDKKAALAATLTVLIGAATIAILSVICYFVCKGSKIAIVALAILFLAFIWGLVYYEHKDY